MNRFATALALLGLLLAAGQVRAGEEAAFLVIRPERVHSQQAADQPGAGFGIRDPFNWPADQLAQPKTIREEPSNPFAALTLEGIIWSTERPLAIVNAKLVGNGDKVAGVTVKEILKEGIVVTHNGRSHTLRLLPPLPETSGEIKGHE